MQSAEANAARFTENGGIGVVLRFGLFYCADSKQTQLQISAARKGLSTFLGDPDAYMPPLHLDDAATAVVSALVAPGGVYNVVDDDPMRKIEADSAFADLLGRSKLRRVPKSLVKIGGDRRSCCRGRSACRTSGSRELPAGSRATRVSARGSKRSSANAPRRRSRYPEMG